MYNYNVINKLIDNKQQEKKSITVGEMASSMGLSLASLNNISLMRALVALATFSLCESEAPANRRTPIAFSVIVNQPPAFPLLHTLSLPRYQW